MYNEPTRQSNLALWWYKQDQRTKLILMVLFVLIAIALCGLIVVAGRSLLAPAPEPTATPTLVPTVAQPAPTWTPTPRPTDTPAPTPTPERAPASSEDLQGDVGIYESGDPVEGVPDGTDIRAVSVDADMHVVLQPTEGVPAELAEWATEAEVLLWIALHEPVPDPLTEFVEWVFVLDLDGDTDTGRPVGAVRINPDLGVEVAIGAYYDSDSEEYVPYLLAWDTEGGMVRKGDVVRFTLDESRTFVGLAIPLQTLTEIVSQTSGVTIAPDAVKGRAAVLARVGEQRVVDFCPDLPD